MKPKIKLMSILLFPLILAFAIFSGIIYEYLITTFRQEVLAKMHNTLEQTKQNMRTYLYSAHEQLRVLSANEMLREYLLTEPNLRYALLQDGILDLFLNYQHNNMGYKEINLLLPNGTFDSRLTDGKLIPLMYQKETIPSYFERIKNSSSILTEHFVSAEEENFFLFSYQLNFLEDYRPEAKETSPLRGYLNFILPPTFLLNSISNTKIGKTGYLLLTDGQGKTVFSLTKQSLALPVFKQVLDSLEKPINISDNKASFYIEGQKLSENLYLFGYLPETEVVNAGDFLKKMLFTTAFVEANIVFILLFILINYFFITPIRQLSKIAEQRLKPNHEIKDISSLFEEVVTRLEKTSDDLEHLKNNFESQLKEKTEALKHLEQKCQTVEGTNHTKSTFIANLSHEFRTPLNGIIGMSEIILNSEYPEELHHQAKVIYDCGNTLLILVEELLDIAQLDAGNIILEHIPFDIRQTLRDGINTVHAKAQQKGLKIQLNTAPLLPQYLIGDAHRLRQILINLLVNAVKFTEQGEINVCTEIIEENQEIITIQINIIDTGIGLSQDKQQLLFKQLENTNAHTQLGMGVGLFVSQRIISLMKGQIGVVSELNKGSTFWIRLSLPIALLPKKSFENFIVQKRIISQQPKNILVVEDDITTQKFMQLMLQKIGCKVDIANNGQKALELIEKNPYDLIFMDIVMPIMDGYRAVKVLREDLELLDLPIVAVSSLEENEQGKVKEVGMNDYLSKPVKPTDLNKMLKKWLKQK